MAAQIDKVISELRDMVLSGALQPGERVVELQFSARLGVSRTPLRIALTELEKEGLLERLPSRGFRVRAFTVDEIGDAVDVRGVLEGMAARLLAERGAPPSAGAAGAGGGRRPPAAGAGAAGSEHHGGRARLGPDQPALSRNPVRGRRQPRAAVGAGTQQQDAAGRPGRADAAVHPSLLETPFVLRAQADHEDLLRAITRREAVRAENLMREHAYRSRENKRVLLESFAARWPRGRCWRTPALEMSARLASRLSYADR